MPVSGPRRVSYRLGLIDFLSAGPSTIDAFVEWKKAQSA